MNPDGKRFADTDEIHYRLAWHPSTGHPGQHRSAAQGDGFEFDSHIPLGEGVDPRRFDLMASARDPLDRLLARRYRQTSSVEVVILADLSASMAVRRGVRKLDMLADFTELLARSVFRNGDSFAFYGCAARILDEFVSPPGRRADGGLAIANKLHAFDARSQSADGLANAASLLTARRKLVFLVSDFFLEPQLLSHTLDALARHAVVPVLLQDSTEISQVPAFGLFTLADVETGAVQTCFMRPSMRARFRDAYKRKSAQLHEICDTRGHALLTATDRIVADDISRHFVYH